MAKSISIRVTDDEHSMLKNLAKSEGKNLSAYVRDKILENQKQEDIDRAELAKFLAKIFGELEKINGILSLKNIEIFKAIARSTMKSQLGVSRLLYKADCENEVKDIFGKASGIIDNFFNELNS